MKRLHTFIFTIITLIAIALPHFEAFALPADHYAPVSVLASGHWVRVRIESSGITHISNTQLKAMGFTDPAKVNVFGKGGAMIPEALTADMSDDLPLIPSVKTQSGLMFYANDCFSWCPSWAYSAVPYAHTINPYSAESYYFLSDIDVTAETVKEDMTDTAGLPTVRSFIARLVHENDIEAPDHTGRQLLGEDFRSQKSRTFDFNLPDNTDGTAAVRVAFGANTSGGASLAFTANGKRLEASTSDKITNVGKDQFIVNATTVKEIEGIDNRLSLGIDFSYSGLLVTARLDYIEVCWPRSLRLHEGSLMFQFDNLEDTAAEISGLSSSSVIWEVTDPAHPRQVSFTLSGSAGIFRSPKGYHEYVAFEPSAIAAKNVTWTKIANQDIHGLPTPDLVIISFDEYMQGANRIAELHRSHDGMLVHVLTPEAIYNEFSGGVPDVSAFRKLLKMWHDRPGERAIRYCLLMGRPSYDNKCVTPTQKSAGYRPMPIRQSPTGTTETSSFSTDAYIAMLDDCTEDNFNIRSAIQHVGVGRLPVKTAAEALEMAAKIENYVKNPTFGSWRNKIMMIADDRDNSIHLEQSQRLYNELTAESRGDRFTYDRLYLDAYPQELSSVGPVFPSAKSRMMRNWNEGVILTTYIGHASPSSWTHEKLLEWSDMISFTNPNLTFLYAATCSFGKWDAPTVSGAEMMVLNPTAGAIGMIVPSRTVYMANNGTLTNLVGKVLLTPRPDGEPYALGDILYRAQNEYVDENKLRFCLMADPAIPVPRPSLSVKISSIDNIDVETEPEALPELRAMGSAVIEGTVTNADGSVVSDFNGNIVLDLYDAEMPVTTIDRASDSKVTVYNDRRTRLSSVMAKVKEGHWSATIMLPSEIDNNYAPAMISAYAWTDTGRDANGNTDRLYVYGYNEESVADTDGPDIERLYLNSAAFADGVLVNSSPILFANVFDKSGINISDSGLGHKMAITIDGKKTYNDVSVYFTHDAERTGAGSVAYPLDDIEPGNHTLSFTVWDNANNSSTASLDFNVGAAVDPVISQLSTDVNPASTDVTFTVGIDRPNTKVECLLEVFNLDGRRVWHDRQDVSTDRDSRIRIKWDLCATSGARVPRGIYLYRATVTAPEGTYTSSTRKLAVTAP